MNSALAQQSLQMRLSCTVNMKLIIKLQPSHKEKLHSHISLDGGPDIRPEFIAHVGGYMGNKANSEELWKCI